MVLYVYTYRLSYGRGRPTWYWVQKSRWLFLRWEDSERFKSVIARLEGWNVPMVAVGRDNRIKGYLVLKVEMVREFLRYSVADLVHDAFISKERLRGLEEMGWDVEVLKPTPKLLALWKVGLEGKVGSKVSEAKEKFYAVLKVLSEGGEDEE
jgi:hypothetical protein